MKRVKAEDVIGPSAEEFEDFLRKLLGIPEGEGGHPFTDGLAVRAAYARNVYSEKDSAAVIMSSFHQRRRVAKRAEPGTFSDMKVRSDAPIHLDGKGLVKCNQCSERLSPKMLGDHKRAMHPLMRKS